MVKATKPTNLMTTQEYFHEVVIHAIAIALTMVDMVLAMADMVLTMVGMVATILAGTHLPTCFTCGRKT